MLVWILAFAQLICNVLAQTSNINTNLTNFMWTFDEQCKKYYGKDYTANRYFSLSNTCSGFIPCQSITDWSLMPSSMPIPDGTLCNPGSVCINQQCVAIPNVPSTVIVDVGWGNIKCNDYLNNTNATFVKNFCNMNFQLCPATCSKYSFITCMDSQLECVVLGGFCNSTYPGTVSLIRDVCPFTCNNCTGLPLRCTAAMNYCFNGGTCQNTTAIAGSKFAFRCVCPPGYQGDLCEMRNTCDPNPCTGGKKCLLLGTYSYMCV